MALMCRRFLIEQWGLLDFFSHQSPWAVRNHPTRSDCIICWMLSFHNFPNIFPRFVLPSGISFHFPKMFLLAKDTPLKIARSKNHSYEQQMTCVFSAISSTALPTEALWPGYGVRRLSSRHGRRCPGSVVKKVQLDEVLARYEGFGEVRLQSPNFVGLFVFLKQTEKHLVEWTVVRHCAIMWWHASVTFAEFFAKLATHRDENPSIELDLQSFTLWYKLDDFAGWGCNFYLLIFEQKECAGFPSQRW